MSSSGCAPACRSVTWPSIHAAPASRRSARVRCAAGGSESSTRISWCSARSGSTACEPINSGGQSSTKASTRFRRASARRRCSPPDQSAGAQTAAAASWSEVPALVVHSRQVRVAGIARTERVCLHRGTLRSAALQASLGVDCCRDPPRPAIVGELASPARGPVVFGMRHGRQAFVPLSGPSGGRGQQPPSPSINPRRVHQSGGKRWGSPVHRVSTLAGATAFVDGGRAPSSIGVERSDARCELRVPK